MDYYVFKQAAMVKLVDTLLLGSSARASRFESEWRHGIFEIIKDFHIVEKFFKCNNCAKCYFYPSICYVGPLNSNASICNISTCSPISMVNDACKYDGIGLCGSFMRIIIISNTYNYYISKRYNNEIQYMNEKSNINIVQNALPGNYYRSQLIEQLDHWSYRVISLGFIFLTIGILSGAVWANEAWGSYWNWDPKETWAFITWTVFAIYLHIRTNKNLRSANSAIVSFIGFLIIWICYFGVNLLGIGLHSYGSFTL
ncbi:Cytochrome c biogenesis protein CcsA [Bienertia sinuspersici]